MIWISGGQYGLLLQLLFGNKMLPFLKVAQIWIMSIFSETLFLKCLPMKQNAHLVLFITSEPQLLACGWVTCCAALNLSKLKECA